MKHFEEECSFLNFNKEELKEDQYELLEYILNETDEEEWNECTTREEVIKKFYGIVFSSIAYQKVIIVEQANALKEMGALKKTQMKKQIADMHNRMGILEQDNKDLLFTNVAMIEKLKVNGIYDGEASKVEKLH